MEASGEAGGWLQVHPLLLLDTWAWGPGVDLKPHALLDKTSLGLVWWGRSPWPGPSLSNSPLSFFCVTVSPGFRGSSLFFLLTTSPPFLHSTFSPLHDSLILLYSDDINYQFHVATHWSLFLCLDPPPDHSFHICSICLFPSGCSPKPSNSVSFSSFPPLA